MSYPVYAYLLVGTGKQQIHQPMKTGLLIVREDSFTPLTQVA
jgi:hypothetical protein